MAKKIFLLLSICLTVLTVKAQKLVASAPEVVDAGTQFRLTYTINSHDVSNFQVGEIPADLEILIGPTTSSQSSYQYINGKGTSTQSITYTFILYASKNGTYKIPSAQIKVNGKKVESNALTVKVEGVANPNNANGQNGSPRNNGRHNQQQDAGSKISSSDLFIVASVSKKRVNEQEPLLLTYKAYTRVGLNNLSNESPDLKGFHVQEINLPQQRSLKRESYNGQAYNSVVWRQYIIFPQMTGEIVIPEVQFEAYVLQRVANVDPFEAFFNGGSGYTEVKKTIKAPAVKIQVDPLPQRPTNFSGGVGDFNISATIDKTEVKANDPINLRVVVSGTGNLKLIKEPAVNFPKDFDIYDAKQTDKTKLTINGLEGSMIYEFLAVPRHQGKYEIPPIEFVYYNPKKDVYETAKTESFALTVAKGDNNGGMVNYNNQEELKELNKDIRYIKTGNVEIRKSKDYFYASTAYWIILALLCIVFVSLFIIFRQKAIENADITRIKGKQANKVASKRLKKAAKLMSAGDASHFYDEVLKALWGYVGDKLSMPIEQLSRENISQRLAERNIDDATISLFIRALDECEFERYAPGDVTGNMNKTYEAAMTAITTIENIMKRTKRSINMKSVVLALLLFPLAVNAQESMFLANDSISQSKLIVSKESGDSAYAKEQYQQAITIYERLLEDGVSPDIYYNLGNAYYRMDNITKAVINYERALRLSPGDADIRFNLQMAREKTIDRITPESEMFFVIWYKSLVNTMSVDGWAKTALFSLALAILLSLVYLFSERIALRKIGFFGGIIVIIVFLASNLFAYQQGNKQSNYHSAIIISSAITVKSTPSESGTDLFVLHEGTKVEIIDDSMEEWKEIRLSDGKEGWVLLNTMEII